MPRARGRVLALVVAVSTALSGCGGGGATRFSGEEAAAGGGGELEAGVASLPAEVDPLRAEGPSELTVVRQVFEPLVSQLRPPYGEGEERRGLALGWEASPDLRVWRFRLRPGVAFQDGARLDADAVVANAERWRSDPAGLALLPGLAAADGPNPGLVRLIFVSPARSLPEQLADPRLGLVSPLAIADGGASTAVRGLRAGSGPFEVRKRETDTLALTRFRRWWGTGPGLGPALDEVVFRRLPAARARARALREGEVRMVTEVPARSAAALRRDPLLAVLGGASGRALAHERSVHGIRGPRPAPLSGVWLSLLAPG